jgi:hypothetical protein
MVAGLRGEMLEGVEKTEQGTACFFFTAPCSGMVWRICD